MTERSNTKYCSDHEVSPLPNNTEKSDEEKDESYYLLMSNRTSSSEEYSDSSLDIALKKITKNKREDVKSSKVKKKLKYNNCKKSLYLTKNLIESWVNTGYLPYQTVSDSAKVVDTDSLNQKHSYHKTCDKITNTLNGQGFVHMDKSNSTKLLCNNNSFNCSSVDTAAYILSNIKAKKKDETMATIINANSSSKILPKNTLHENTSLEKDETQNMHLNLNLSMSNVCDSGTKPTKNKTEENNINNENDSTLKTAINIENSFNLKRSRQKKLYTGRDSPTDIIEAQSKNNNVINMKNLHPAFRNSPPPEESSKKLLQRKRRKSKIVINNPSSKFLDNIPNDNLEEKNCTTRKETIFVDLEDNLTSFQNSIPSERLHISCNALIEQIKRFPTSDYINNINNEKRNLRKRIPKTKKAASKTTLTTDDISIDFQEILRNNPYVILNRLPEKIIQNYAKKETLQTPKEKLMKSNKINDEQMCNNNSNLKKCLNNSSTIFNFETAINDPIESDVSTIILYNENVSVSNNYPKSDCSTTILNSSQSLNSDNVNYKSDKDIKQNQFDRDLEQNQMNKDIKPNQLDKNLEQNLLDKNTEQNQLDKNLEQIQSDRDEEQNQLDKDIEQNQLDKHSKQNQSDRGTEQNQLDKDLEENQSHRDTDKNQSDKDLDMGLDKELDKNLNKDLDDEKLKRLQPIIIIKDKIQRTLKNSNDIDKSELPPLTKRMKIQRRVNNSNDIETLETYVKRTSERKVYMLRKSSDCISQPYGKKHMTSSLINISSNTAFIKTLQPIVILTKPTDLRNLKTNCSSSREERLNKLQSSDNKLSMRPVVKLKQLSPKYSVKNLYKNNNKRYKDSSEDDEVQVKEKKYSDKLRKNLSLNNSNSKRTEPLRQTVEKKEPVKNIKKLPIFYTRDSYLHHNSDSNSKSEDSDLDTNQSFMQHILNFYKDKTQHEGKNTDIINSNSDVVKSINPIIDKRMKIQRRVKSSNDIDKSKLSPLTKRMKIQRRVKNSNDIETLETYVKRTSERKVHMLRKSSDCISQPYEKKHMTSSLINISSNTAFIKTLQPIAILTKPTDLRNLKTNCSSSREEQLNKLKSSDNKLSMRPVVKLKQLSPKYSVKSLHKNNNKRYKDSSEDDEVQVKEKKYSDKLRKNLSLNNSNSKRTEPLRQTVEKKEPVKNIKKLPIFYTRDSYLHYNSDSNSKSEDSDLDTNQSFMQRILNFYKDETQHEGKNTDIINSSNSDMVKSINPIILFKHTNTNISVQSRSHSIENRSILHNVGTLLNNTKMTDIEVNMTCPNSNEQCKTKLKRISRKDESINEKDKKKLIVNKKNHSRKYVFTTKAYEMETDSDSSRSE